MEGKQFHIRVRLVAAVLAVMLLLFVGVLYNLQKVNGAYYREQSTKKIANRETVEAARGELLDRYGRVLVSNRATYQVTLDTSLMGTEAERNPNLLELLAVCRAHGQTWTDTIPISADAPFVYTSESALNGTYVDEDGVETEYRTNFGRLLDELNLKSLRDLGRDPTASEVMAALREFYMIDDTVSDADARALVGVLCELRLRSLDIVRTEYVFTQDVDVDFIAAVKERKLRGVRIDTATVREYETTYAAHLLGRVGAIQNWDDYRDKGYSMSDTVGIDGVERAFEDYLRGKAGVRTLELSTSGKIVSESWDTDLETGEVLEPQPGNNVIMTLDIKLQEVVERSLAQRIPELPSEQTEGAAAVVLDMTGGVLAMASYPTYDLSTIYSSSASYQAVAQDPLNPLYNRATMGTYSPGSTFKMITAVGALQEEIITPDYEYKCEGRYKYYSRIEDQPMCWIYRQYGGTHGWEDVSGAIKDSCNIFFYDAGRQLGIDRLDQYAAMFGLGESTGIEVGDAAGVVSSPAYTESLGQTWYEGNTMYAAIGQENTRSTPVQLANYIATLANGGKHYPVHLLKTVKTNDFSQVVEEYEPEPLDTIDISRENLAAVLEGMREVASGDGTAAKYFADLGVTVGAKTGSAQVSSDSETNAVFVCFAPFENPEVAIAIVAEKGGSGAELGAVAADILSYYFSAEETIESIDAENTLLR